MWSIIEALFGTCWVIGLTTYTYALTSSEASYFYSEEVPVLRDRLNLVGNVAIGNNQDGTHTLRSNGIPDNAPGTFPNDNDPFSILEQGFSVRFPRNPILNEDPLCIPANSIIGFAVNGVAIYSAFDEASMDLNDIDFAGGCQGRTASGGIYYFAQVPDACSTFVRLDSDQIFGVAIDGFPIYGPGEGANKVTNADLDACHGKMEPDGQYRYYMTDEWPYVLGCFRGTPTSVLNGNEVLILSSVCKFACNKDAQSNNVTCVDDFPVTTESATEPPSTTLGGSQIKYSLLLVFFVLVISIGFIGL